MNVFHLFWTSYLHATQASSNMISQYHPAVVNHGVLHWAIKSQVDVMSCDWIKLFSWFWDSNPFNSEANLIENEVKIIIRRRRRRRRYVGLSLKAFPTAIQTTNEKQMETRTFMVPKSWAVGLGLGWGQGILPRKAVSLTDFVLVGEQAMHGPSKDCWAYA